MGDNRIPDIKIKDAEWSITTGKDQQQRWRSHETRYTKWSWENVGTNTTGVLWVIREHFCHRMTQPGGNVNGGD
jgi:hypothetical protein